MLRAPCVIFILPFVQIFTDEWSHPMENGEISLVKFYYILPTTM